MGKIPKQLNDEINADPAYRFCMKAGHLGHVCDGRLTRDHTATFAGEQIQLKGFIISVCEFGHSVGKFQDSGDHNKEVHLWIAVNRATDEEMLSVSKYFPYTREKMRLNEKYGKWEQLYPTDTLTNPLGIHYGPVNSY